LQRYVERLLTVDLERSVAVNPVTAVIGPRQCGKSTLVRHVLAGRGDTIFLDLELSSDLRKLSDPELFLKEHANKLIYIDEAQNKPDLFPILRALVDMDRRPGRFVILGSASRDMIRQSSETLAGRIHYVELTPLSGRNWNLWLSKIAGVLKNNGGAEVSHPPFFLKRKYKVRPGEKILSRIF
jgi:uncharacterized protein